MAIYRARDMPYFPQFVKRKANPADGIVPVLSSFDTKENDGPPKRYLDPAKAAYPVPFIFPEYMDNVGFLKDANSRMKLLIADKFFLALLFPQNENTSGDREAKKTALTEALLE